MTNQEKVKLFMTAADEELTVAAYQEDGLFKAFMEVQAEIDRKEQKKGHGNQTGVL